MAVQQVFGKREKLMVEFEVEKTVKHPLYPQYEEKYLMYNGERIPYKAILKDGKFVAIVGRAYRLVPNEFVVELVKKAVARSGGRYNITQVLDMFRKVVILIESGDVGAVIRNAVDGTWSLRADVLVTLDKGAKAIIAYGGSQVLRKHTPNIDKLLSDLDRVILEILDKAKKFKRQLAESTVEVGMDDYRDLCELLPKKYLRRLKIDLFYNRTLPIWRAYADVAREIWCETGISFDRKITLYDTLNKWLFMKVEWLE